MCGAGWSALFPADLAVAASLEDAVAALKDLEPFGANMPVLVEGAKEKAKETVHTHPGVPEHMRAALAFYVADSDGGGGGGGEVKDGAEAAAPAAASSSTSVYDLIDQALKGSDPIQAVAPWRDLLCRPT